MKPAQTVVPKIRKRRESFVALRSQSNVASVAADLHAREFMVWCGDSEAVGPVSADQIARGIRAGKVPPDACVQRSGDLFPFNVLDEPDVIAALEQLPET